MNDVFMCVVSGVWNVLLMMDECLKDRIDVACWWVGSSRKEGNEKGRN